MVMVNLKKLFGRMLFNIVSHRKAKVDDLAAELDASQKECRNYSTGEYGI